MNNLVAKQTKKLTFSEKFFSHTFDYSIQLEGEVALLTGTNRPSGQKKGDDQPTIITREAAERLFLRLMPDSKDTLHTLREHPEALASGGNVWVIDLTKYYVVTLTVQVSGYEKSVLHLVQAKSPELAYALAVESEAHNATYEEGAYVVEDDDSFTYSLRSVLEVPKNEVSVLARYLS